MRESAEDAVVLSGCGWVTPFACGSIAEVLTAASTQEISVCSGGYWGVPDATVEAYATLSKELRRDKGAWLTAVAVEHALRSASLDLADFDMSRVGLVLGCGLAGQIGMIEFANEVRGQTPRFVSPIHFPQTVGNYIAAALARGYQLRGPNVTLAGGLASGIDAMIEACRLVVSGRADVVIAGGTERLSEELALGMSEPGVVLSEGACLFVLERAEHAAGRGVKPLAFVSGMGASGGGDREPGDAGSSCLVSTAGVAKADGVFIEACIGRCIGAGGAAAVAAAIAAASGLAVPVSPKGESTSVSMRSFDKTVRDAATASRRAVVWAGDEGDRGAALELTFLDSP